MNAATALATTEDNLPDMPDDLTDGWRERYPEIGIRYQVSEVVHRFKVPGKRWRGHLLLERVSQCWFVLRVVNGRRTARRSVRTYDDLHAYVVDEP